MQRALFQCSSSWMTRLRFLLSAPLTTSNSLMRSTVLHSLVGMIVSLQWGIGQAEEVHFDQDIRPIFAEHCLNCHGPDEKNREGDLRLDLEAEAKDIAITSGEPEASSLIERIRSNDPDVVMPPPQFGKPLTAKQIDILCRWIAEGAKYQGHWSFEPIREPEIPTPKSDTATEIDRFIVAKLESRGLSLSPRIHRRQLIRRATFDLTGLPPTWQEVEAFVNDDSPEAFANVIDRLLQSPRYGERWGRHWLDIARYADTHGGSAIGFTKFPFSYTYRDYVINAFNADLSYDRFVTQQLAADQLGLDENDPALAGLGFLTIGMRFRNHHDVIDDQIDVVTRGLMGLTVACAAVTITSTTRCQRPITTRSTQPLPAVQNPTCHRLLERRPIPLRITSIRPNWRSGKPFTKTWLAIKRRSCEAGFECRWPFIFGNSPKARPSRISRRRSFLIARTMCDHWC